MTKLTGLIFPTQYHLLEELETQGGTFCGNLPGFLLNECWGDLSLFSPKKSPGDPNAAGISPNTYACTHTHTHTCKLWVAKSYRLFSPSPCSQVSPKDSDSIRTQDADCLTRASSTLTLPPLTSTVQHLSEKGVCTGAPNPREPGIYLSFPSNQIKCILEWWFELVARVWEPFTERYWPTKTTGSSSRFIAGNGLAKYVARPRSTWWFLP